MGLSKASGLFELWRYRICHSRNRVTAVSGGRCGLSITSRVRRLGVFTCVGGTLCILSFARVPPQFHNVIPQWKCPRFVHNRNVPWFQFHHAPEKTGVSFAASLVAKCDVRFGCVGRVECTLGLRHGVKGEVTNGGNTQNLQF